VNRQVAALVAVTAVATLAACSETVGGLAQRSVTPAPEQARDFGYVDDRCGRLADSTVQATLSASDIARPYSGAVCQYVLSRRSVTVDATFSWFETGTLAREREEAVARGAQITDTVVERHDTMVARHDVTGAACSATAAAGPGPDAGVLSWWVQYRGQQSGDPCDDAKNLLAATVSSEM
jgi:hypothetical protein